MNFKEWLRLDEMGRARVPTGESFNVPNLPDPKTGARGPDVTVTSNDIIDMRFEDYGAPFGDFSQWQVRLPDGRYLINHGMYKYEISKAPGKYKDVPETGTATDEAIQASMDAKKAYAARKGLPEPDMTPEDRKSHPWYDFAEVISNQDQIIKQPLYRQTLQ